MISSADYDGISFLLGALASFAGLGLIAWIVYELVGKPKKIKWQGRIG